MNSESTLKAMELAHQLLEGNLLDKKGALAVNDKFFEGLDEVLKKFSQTRELAETMR
ncbi:hypothetical protein JHD50_12780 [Sulfurimonas sp. MAG313]|nr:hypothetical protein [Sulfurimonas sp. MAG313]MDF1882162.1 hypothetical protein [Sulfurimonas sp. MAG313]